MRTVVLTSLLFTSAVLAQTVYVDDPLTDATHPGRGSRGGSFSPTGWTTSAEPDAVWYEIPDALPSARIEYTVTGLSINGSMSGEKHDILTVYQAPTGLGEPVAYTPGFRDNDFKAFTRLSGILATGRQGAMKLEVAACPRGDPWYHADVCPAGCDMSGIAYARGQISDVGWDPAASYRMVLEWSPGSMSFSRDGELLGTVTFAGTYAPQPMRVRLGSPRHDGVYPGIAMMPLGITIKDVKISGTPGTATPVCGAAGGGAGGGSGGGAGGGSGAGGGGGSGSSSTSAVLADVTAAVWEPAVFSDVNDLNVEGDGAGNASAVAYLRFPPLPGPVSRATLTVHTQSYSSATGGSGRVCAVADTSWNEAAMTWATHPLLGACTGSSVTVDPNQEVQWDVTSLLQANPAGSLAIVSVDPDGSHFLSKESGGAALGPRLSFDLLPVDPDAGVPVTDAGTPGADAGSWLDAPPVAPDAGTGGVGGSDGGGIFGNAQCGCSAGGAPVWGVLVLLAARRRRPARREVTTPPMAPPP